MKEVLKLDITLIVAAPENDPLVGNMPFMPLSLPILAAAAPEHKYTFIDMLSEKREINFDISSPVIGISYRQAAEKTAFALGDKFLKLGKTVVFGGAQPSVSPYNAKEHCTSVVIGEAEELWSILLDDYLKNSLKEYYVCAEKDFDSKGKSSFVVNKFPDLQNLPLPDRSIFKKKYTFDMTFASRGCPINCDFCIVSDVFGKRMRFKPVEDVVKDIKQFKNFYYILDETVFGRPNCYDYYIELYDKIAELPKKKYWTGQANIDAASNEKGRTVIQKAAKAGLVYAAVGLESINKETLKLSGAFSKMGIKNENDYISKMKENIAFIQEQGILVSGWFAIGYENDTVQTYYDTLEFCKETNILPVFTPVMALSGSRLWERIEKEGRLQERESHISNIKHPVMSDTQIAKALYDTSIKGYNTHENIRRLKYYFKLFRKSEKNFNDALYKTIFAYITQNKMQKLVLKETKFLLNRIENTI